MKLQKIAGFLLTAWLVAACNTQKPVAETTAKMQDAKAFDYVVEQFADIKVLRYQIPGWENLSLKEQKLVYYLTQAGTSGRDIMWDQNYRNNLKIRKALENIYQN